MNEIVFARTRWSYDSYTDYWKLVELSGFPIIFVDEMDPSSGDIYIISPMNGEMMDYVAGRFDNKFSEVKNTLKSKFVMWNLERPGDAKSTQQFAADNWSMLEKYFHYIMVSDLVLAREASLNYVVMGCVEGLGTPGALDSKKYDLIHLACYSNHRSELFKTPSQPKPIYRGYSVAPNGWGQDRHKRLQETRCMLNIHQDVHPYIEPLRFVLAVAYGLPIISEGCINSFPYIFGNHVFDLDSLNAVMVVYEDLYDKTLQYRDQFLKDFQFRDCVEKAIKDLS